jgi:hypothetical protein
MAFSAPDGPNLAAILAQLQASAQAQHPSMNPGGPMQPSLGNIGSALTGGGLGASYGAPPALSPGDLPAVGPNVSQSTHQTINRLQQLGGILKQLGHPAFQGSHLPGLPPGLLVPHHGSASGVHHQAVPAHQLKY